MTVGQREKIAYRVVVRAGRSGSFLPPFGVGYGVNEGLGIVLNRTVKGPTKYRAVERTITGKVVVETAKVVTIELANGDRLQIPVSHIIQRTVISQ